jgi:shikimate kinase
MWTSLVGFTASGKSSVVAALGRATQRRSVDLDKRVEEMAGCPVREIFQTGGVERFRNLEGQALRSLASGDPLLIATGGGCVETPEYVRLLRDNGVVIWLDATWEVLRARIESDLDRLQPMVDHLGFDGLQMLYRRRTSLFARAAHFRLCTDRVTVADVARHAMVRSLLWQQRTAGGPSR